MATYAERAHAYAQAVHSGEIVACKWTKLACKRYARDLKRSKTKAFPYRFDGERAGARICRFVELFPHIKGKWAAKRELIRLEDWQCFWLCNAFGWVHKETGLRRFRRAVLFVPRKNAKSTVAAACGNYGLTADGHFTIDGKFVPEFGAEVYAGATTEKQAFEVFRPAWLMAKKTPEFTDYYGVTLGGTEKNPGTLYCTNTSSRFEVVIGKPGDGASPSMSITDEYHEHETSDQLDTMTTGMGAREQPLAIIISTSGTNIAGPCHELWKYLEKVLLGVIEDEQLFGVIYTVDAGVDWRSELALRMANPNYGVSVNPEQLLAAQREAINDSRQQNIFRCKHLNIWNNARVAWMNMDWWHRQADATLSPQVLAGERCWLTVDLASKLDLTSVCITFRRDIADAAGVPRPHVYQFWRNYLPEETADEPSKQHYAKWKADGELIVTDGNVVDYERVKNDVLDLCEELGIEAVGYDPWSAGPFAQELQKLGIRVLEIPQNPAQMSEPMKWMEALVKDGRYHHAGEQVATWSVSNVICKVDANDNVFPRKERPELKIDPAVTGIMGVKLALADEIHAASVYESYSEEEWSGKPRAAAADATTTTAAPGPTAAAAPPPASAPPPRRRAGRSIYEDYSPEEWGKR